MQLLLIFTCFVPDTGVNILSAGNAANLSNLQSSVKLMVVSSAQLQSGTAGKPITITVPGHTGTKTMTIQKPGNQVLNSGQILTLPSNQILTGAGGQKQVMIGGKQVTVMGQKTVTLLGNQSLSAHGLSKLICVPTSSTSVASSTSVSSSEATPTKFMIVRPKIQASSTIASPTYDQPATTDAALAALAAEAGLIDPQEKETDNDSMQWPQNPDSTSKEPSGLKGGSSLPLRLKGGSKFHYTKLGLKGGAPGRFHPYRRPFRLGLFGGNENTPPSSPQISSSTIEDVDSSPINPPTVDENPAASEIQEPETEPKEITGEAQSTTISADDVEEAMQQLQEGDDDDDDEEDEAETEEPEIKNEDDFPSLALELSSSSDDIDISDETLDKPDISTTVATKPETDPEKSENQQPEIKDAETEDLSKESNDTKESDDTKEPLLEVPPNVPETPEGDERNDTTESEEPEEEEPTSSSFENLSAKLEDLGEDSKVPPAPSSSELDSSQENECLPTVPPNEPEPQPQEASSSNGKFNSKFVSL